VQVQKAAAGVQIKIEHTARARLSCGLYDARCAVGCATMSHSDWASGVDRAELLLVFASASPQT
jgi:hypothetical protein